jgi:hypothetical protein
MKSGYDRDERTTEEILRAALVRIEDIAEDERRRRSDLPILLKLIDALVILDDQEPGFDGRICFIVSQQGTTFYWRGVFTAAKKVRAGFVDGIPDDIDAALTFDEAAANAILAAQPTPENWRPVTYGNRELFHTFVARYVRSYMSAHPAG